MGCRERTGVWHPWRIEAFYRAWAREGFCMVSRIGLCIDLLPGDCYDLLSCADETIMGMSASGMAKKSNK